MHDHGHKNVPQIIKGKDSLPEDKVALQCSRLSFLAILVSSGR